MNKNYKVFLRTGESVDVSASKFEFEDSGDFMVFYRSESTDATPQKVAVFRTAEFAAWVLQ